MNVERRIIKNKYGSLCWNGINRRIAWEKNHIVHDRAKEKNYLKLNDRSGVLSMQLDRWTTIIPNYSWTKINPYWVEKLLVYEWFRLQPRSTVNTNYIMIKIYYMWVQDAEDGSFFMDVRGTWECTLLVIHILVGCSSDCSYWKFLHKQGLKVLNYYVLG